MTTKRNVVLYLDAELVRHARDLGFNLSKTFENHLYTLINRFYFSNPENNGVLSNHTQWCGGSAPNNIRTTNQVRAQVIVTGSASADLQKKVIDNLEIYIPRGESETITSQIGDLEIFFDFIVQIIDTMIPNLGDKVVLVSVENTIRDAYRYHGRIVFNFNRYVEEKSKFYWFFVSARELAYLLHNRYDYKHNNLMRALLMEAYKRGF